MTGSLLLKLAQAVGPRATRPAPTSSYLADSLWDRFFAQEEAPLQEQEPRVDGWSVDQNRQFETVELEEPVEDCRVPPIQREDVRLARKNFLRDGYRNLLHQPSPYETAWEIPRRRDTNGDDASPMNWSIPSRKQLENPDLRIPMGRDPSVPEYIYVAQ